MKTGYMVLSLDVELMWGVHDHRSIQNYGANVRGAREAIPIMLEIFKAQGIRATWAAVGLLFCENKAELLANLPDKRPAYSDPKLNNYAYLDEVGADESDDVYHYGGSLIKKIMQTPYQEVGTHTLSHYYCLADGQTKAEFAADIAAAKKVAAAHSIVFKSIVFPRNQFNVDYLEALTQNGIFTYRGNGESWLNKNPIIRACPPLQRLLRLIDTYLNITGSNCYALADTIGVNNMFNVRASRFLRPYSANLDWLEGWKIRRIKAQMRYAARKGLIFHMWWHPHNYGTNLDKNLAQLQQILDYYAFLHKTYGFESKNMYGIEKEARKLSGKT